MVKVLFVIGQSPLSTFQELYDFFITYGMIEKLRRKNGFAILKYRKQFSYQKVLENRENLIHNGERVKIELANINSFDIFNFTLDDQGSEDQIQDSYESFKKNIKKKEEHSINSQSDEGQEQPRSETSSEFCKREYDELEKEKESSQEKKEDPQSIASETHPRKEKKKGIKELKKIIRRSRKRSRSVEMEFSDSSEEERSRSREKKFYEEKPMRDSYLPN